MVMVVLLPVFIKARRSKNIILYCVSRLSGSAQD